MIPPENVIPTPTSRMCISIKDKPARAQWIIYRSGATKRKVNSRGSVIPVRIAVRAAESKSPPATFFFVSLAQVYIASAAPGKPNIINGNLPLINLVAETEKT